MSIILRVAKGVQQHFGIRVPEWVMGFAMAGWSMVLIVDPNTFGSSKSFSVLQMYGTEFFWSNVCFIAAFLRILALIVNGTFRGFRYSPHLRCGAAIVAATVWGQILLGVTISWIWLGGAATGIPAYATLLLFEIVNTFRSSADISAGWRSR